MTEELEGQARERGEDQRLMITLFCKGEDTRTLEVERLSEEIGEDELVWVEMAGQERDCIVAVCERLGLSRALSARLSEDWGHPWIDSDGAQFALCASTVRHVGQLEFQGCRLLIACGRNFVITLHPEPVAFLDDLRQREARRSRVGALSADSFVASLLGWQLESYFEAAADFERNVERLEEAVLRSHSSQEMKDLRRLRKGASRLRRMLAPHRAIFAAIARPDFRPDADRDTERHFRQLAEHFERAMDVIENARDLVIGSFELFSNQIALQTNSTMRALTFITVVIGLQTVIAGVLGMNFDAPFFKTQAAGFWGAVAVMGAVAAAAALLGRRRKWF